MRRLCVTLAFPLGLLVLLIELGTFVPGLPILGALGTMISGCFTLHVTLTALLATLSALGALRAGSGRRVKILLAVNALLAALSLVPLTLLVARAHQSASPIDWLSHLRIGYPGAEPPPETRQFASVGGKALFLDIYRADGVNHELSIPAVMIHGGGFVAGKRSDGHPWDHWLAARGYTVFDVDYRLAPPASWNLAAADVACALAWIQAHAEELGVDAKRTLIVGQSAGASLALEVAYGLKDASVASSCGGEASPPTALFAFYPVEDFVLAWNEDLKIGPLALRHILSDYIGGSPAEYPARYETVSPIHHVAPGLPPTFIAYGTHDHVVPVDGQQVFASKLTASGVPHHMIEIPWSDHGFDLAWGSIGGQITRHELTQFLAQYAPTGTASR